MIVDSSAVLAILLGELDAAYYEKAIAAALTCRMSAANVLEAAIVVESRGGWLRGMNSTSFWKGRESNWCRSRLNRWRLPAGHGGDSAGATIRQV